MSVADGTYEIISALDPTLALDAEGALSTVGGAIQVYTRNKSDAQYVHVRGNTFIFPLTGLVMDIQNGKLASGQKIWQYDFNGTNAQKFVATEDGKSVSVEGKSYPTYVISVESNTDLCVDVKGASSSPGTDVWLYAKNNTDAQRWAFIPNDPVPTGTYSIRTGMNQDMVLDVVGNGQTNGTNVQIYPDNDTNAQIWKITNKDSGLSLIQASQSGKAMDVVSAQAVSGANVQIYDVNNTDAQDWLVQPMGTLDRNGTIVPAYSIRTKIGANLVLDVVGASSTMGTNVQIYKSNNTIAQKFEIRPDEMYDTTLPVPSAVNSNSMNGVQTRSLQIVGEYAFAPQWLCSGDDYQVRFRRRKRIVGGSVESWSEWSAVDTHLLGNGGWGLIGHPNVSFVNSGRLKTSPYTYTETILPSSGNTDYVEYQFEVRRFSNQSGGLDNKLGANGHGGSLLMAYRLLYHAALTFDDLAFTPEGIKTSFSSDLQRGGNKVTVTLYDSVGTRISAPYTVYGAPYSDAITIPMSYLESIPDDGTSVRLEYSLVTSDGASRTDSQSMTLEFDVNHGLDVTPTLIAEDATVHGTTVANARCWLVVHRGHGDMLVELDTSQSGGNTIFDVLPPIGVEWHMFVTAESGLSWGSSYVAGPEIHENPALYRWDWKGGKAAIAFNEGNYGPAFTPSYTSDAVRHTTTGREREVVTYGKTVASNINVDGVVVPGYDVKNGVEDDIDNLLHQTHVLFRSPRGYWCYAAILGGTFDLGKATLHKVTITQCEETR